MSANNFTTQRDIVKPVQAVAEGTTPATYGITPNNPVFAQVLQDAAITDSSTPTTVDIRKAGSIYNRVEKRKVREVNTLTVKGYLRDADKDIIKASFNEAGTPSADTSYTFMQSRNDADGTERYYFYRGCRIEGCTVNVDNNGVLAVDITIRFKAREVVPASGINAVLGTGSFVDTDTGAVLDHKDVSTTYNGAAIAHRAASITSARELAMMDSAGSEQDLYCKVARAIVSGSLDIFSRGDTLQADALAVNSRPAVFTMASITFTISKLVFDPSGEEVKGDSADATIESKSFEASSVVVS